MASQNRPNIVLTGMDGTGKRAVGRRLSTHTGRDFVDMTAEIAAAHGDLTDDVRSAEIERDMITSLAPRRDLVIATSETTMLDQDNVVALLGAEVFTLTSSVTDMRKQLDATNDERSAEDLQQLLDERAEGYGRFTTVDTTGKTAEEVIDALRAAGASISDGGEAEGEAAAAAQDNVNRVFMIIIAAALAVFIVLLFLVLTF